MGVCAIFGYSLIHFGLCVHVGVCIYIYIYGWIYVGILWWNICCKSIDEHGFYVWKLICVIRHVAMYWKHKCICMIICEIQLGPLGDYMGAI